MTMIWIIVAMCAEPISTIDPVPISAPIGFVVLAGLTLYLGHLLTAK